jgi:signal transduction histidine kinase
VVLATATVSLVPLFITTAINYLQYRQAIRTEAVQQISRLTLNTKRSLELFLSERRSALTFINNDRSFEELCSEESLRRIIAAMNRSLEVGAFVDLGLIDDTGEQLCYSGPYQLEGRDYSDQDWFHEVARRGTYTSDVFLGFRELPHFVIASRHERPDGGFYVLRATVDAEMLGEQVLTAGLEPTDDVFLVNREGVLQTPSRRWGPVLTEIPLAVPETSSGVGVSERQDEAGRPVFLATATIDGSPFVLMMVKHAAETMGRWFTLRSELIGFSVISAGLILGVILWGSALFVNNMREASLRRAALMHQVEYTNKLASIGRLAAGVAHEINNPLAIINEKAGLLHDLVDLDDGIPRRDKLLGLVDSILRSVDRCKAITHRLLGFARHMDVTDEPIDIGALLKEVLGFLGKEAEYRNLDLTLSVADDLPTLISDRGQLQQVFLNILNNALAAVEDGGRIDIEAVALDDRIAVSVADDGIGISEENLERIFEPFFTTKDGVGTGLGLSITYGIVNKLGGHIDVESERGQGTRFTVVLPTARQGEPPWTT